MIRVCMVFLLAIGFLLGGMAVKISIKKDAAKEKDYKRTTATITKAIQSDGGSMKYYVMFFNNGTKAVAETCYYSSSTKSLNPGEKVEIGYYRVGDVTRAVIYDNRIVRCTAGLPNFYRFLMAGGILLFVIAVLELAKTVV